MKNNRHNHASFLLRLWRADSAIWLASLEDTFTGERKGFANMDLLVQFLKSLTGETDSGDIPTGERKAFTSVDTLVQRLRSLNEVVESKEGKNEPTTPNKSPL